MKSQGEVSCVFVSPCIALFPGVWPELSRVTTIKQGDDKGHRIETTSKTNTKEKHRRVYTSPCLRYKLGVQERRVHPPEYLLEQRPDADPTGVFARGCVHRGRREHVRGGEVAQSLERAR